MKVFVFDFDHTIVKGHTHNTISLSKREGANQPVYVNSSWAVVRDFSTIGSESDWKRIFETLLEQGHYLSIASFNAYGSIIPEFLSKIGLSEDIIQHIDIIAKFPKNSNTANKNGYINQAFSNAKLNHPKKDLDEVILIDDSRKNIQAAKKLGYTTIQADNLGSHLQQLLENYIAPAVNRHLKPAILPAVVLSRDQYQPATQAKGEQKITEDANFTKNSAWESESKAIFTEQSETERQHSEGLVNSDESLVLSQIATLEQRKRRYLEKLNQAISENEKESIDDYRDELSAIEVSLATKKNYLKRNEVPTVDSCSPIERRIKPNTLPSDPKKREGRLVEEALPKQSATKRVQFTESTIEKDDLKQKREALEKQNLETLNQEFSTIRQLTNLPNTDQPAPEVDRKLKPSQLAQSFFSTPSSSLTFDQDEKEKSNKKRFACKQ